MKARIPKNEYDPNTIGVPKKLIEDKQYAKEFWEYLTQNNKDENYGETFDEWYDKIRTVDFMQKIRTTHAKPNRATRRANAKMKRRAVKDKKGDD